MTMCAWSPQRGGKVTSLWAMGIGEPIISPSGPAITMAVYNACGIELEEYPYLPAKVLAALKEKEDRA